MRRYDEAIDVHRRNDIPAEFLWRGRLYVVQDVCATWVETPPWWLAPAARALYGQAAEGAVPVTAPISETAEQEMWRVEAGAGRSGGSGVFDLCHDWSTGAWKLAQVVD